ncbi:MAG: hypothetical protein PUB12_00685 [[Clostridium] aminophilum]|uniref:hypothetical protein n=1 Tax=[Clostridium] aminophilum TaxID=1526 RepID=UPI0026E9351B|nr:hypothetical protein [[Clostridium] aminophilum]MDD6195411.1 hypothetical protein [[Clostridium] aminophilum]
MDRKTRREIEKKQQNIERVRRMIRHEREVNATLEQAYATMNRLIHYILTKTGPIEIDYKAWHESTEDVIFDIRDPEKVMNGIVVLMTPEQAKKGE